jgi:hypothetical protein
MANQMPHLAATAAMPTVTMQILPAVAHPAGASGCIVTDSAAYAEHVAGGFTYTDEETVSSLLRLFNSIHSESYRASESLRMFEGMAEAWTGGSPAFRRQRRGMRRGRLGRGRRGPRHHRPRRRDAEVHRRGLAAVHPAPARLASSGFVAEKQESAEKNRHAARPGELDGAVVCVPPSDGIFRTGRE